MYKQLFFIHISITLNERINIDNNQSINPSINLGNTVISIILFIKNIIKFLLVYVEWLIKIPLLKSVEKKSIRKASKFRKKIRKKNKRKKGKIRKKKNKNK